MDVPLFYPDDLKTDEIRNKYVQATVDELTKAGCKAPKHESSPRRAALEIEINETQYVSAIENEYLTGLSFGLIPSWETRYAEIRFKIMQDNRTGVYAVDDKRFNHIVVFPVFWLTFFMQDEH